MKKQLLTLVIILAGWGAMAQNNTFPPTGNAGIGTTAPGANLVIQAATPELRFITTADSTNFARFLRSTASSNNLFSGRNKVLQAGAIGNAVNLVGGVNYTGSDAGFPTGSSITLSISVWVQSHTAGTGIGAIFGYGGSGGLGLQIGGGLANQMYLTQSGIISTGGNYPLDTLWHHLVVIVNGTSLNAYVDGALNWNTTISYSSITLNGVFKNADPYTTATNASFDQLLVYNRAITSTEVTTIYNSGNGTGLLPSSGLIRRYDFDDGAGTTAVDGNPTSSIYPITLSSSTALLYPGKVPISTSPSESAFFSISDGIANAEKGIDTWGDGNGRNQQAGKWFQWQQGNNYPLVSNNTGHWLFNPNNTSASLPTVASTIDVAGNVTVGSAYAGTNAAPANGLIVQGNTGIGTATPAYPLQINQPLNGQGTISVSASSGTVTGTGTFFFQDFNIGDVIKANGETHIISAITSNTALTTDNWTTTFGGIYTTANTQRYSFSGKGTLYMGNILARTAADGILNIRNNLTNGPKGRNEMSILGTNQYTTAPNTSTNLGISLSTNIGGSNTQNWTAPNSLIGLQSFAGTVNGATGTITGVVGIRSQIGTASSTAPIANAYIYQGAIQPFNSTPVISNLAGMLLYNLNAGTNNTGLFLDIGTPGVVSPIPAGNWGVYDNTGYKSYFAGSIGIGTTDPKGYKLAVNGSAIATSVVVKAYANWPDYVFKKEHELMPLADLKAYVDKNQHLPEIPSAAEVEKNGQDLGEMNKLLVKKMEEMTLYMIEKDKQIKDQQAELKAQEQRLKTLEQQIEKIAKKY